MCLTDSILAIASLSNAKFYILSSPINPGSMGGTPREGNGQIRSSIKKPEAVFLVVFDLSMNELGAT